MKIGTCQSKKGKIQSGFLNISHQGKRMKIPIKILEGKKEGKTCFISAGMHGDELNGIYIVSKYIKSINPKKVNGTIIFIPVINRIGFHYGERKIRYDDKDLNRCFNRKGNTFSHKVANTIFKKIVKKSDFGLDIHDSNKKNVLLPHARTFKKANKELDKISQVFGTEIVMKREGSRGMLAKEALKKKVPVLTIETSGGMRLSPTFTAEAIRGINNVLAYYGMLEENINLPQKQFILDERIGYRSNMMGILKLNKKLGDSVEKGEIIAEVFNPSHEKFKELKSKNPGVLFSIKSNAHIKANQRAFSILYFKKRGINIVPTQGKMIENIESPIINIINSGIFNNSINAMTQHSKKFFYSLLNN